MFLQARLKAKRAEHHVKEFYAFMESSASALDVHSACIELNSRYEEFELVVTIHKRKEELRDEAAIRLGDIYHNLRSALDIMWYEIVSPTGLQTKWTRFPIADTRKDLIGAKLGPAHKDGKITKTVCEFVLDTVKPYREGNFILWSVEEANIIDKHQLLIPNISLMAIHGVRIQNDKEVIEIPTIITDSTCSFRASRLDIQTFGNNPKVIDEGHIAIGYAFGFGHPQEGEPVLPTLDAITKEVRRTIEAFNVLLG